jgi:hypothetical protein
MSGLERKMGKPYGVLEDSPDRLVLDNRWSTHAGTAICFGLAAVTWFGYPEGRGRTMEYLCLGLIALGLLSLLRWRQLAFDGRSRTFQSRTLFSTWTVELARVEGVETDTVKKRKSEHEREHNPTSGVRHYHAYRAFLLVAGKRILLNESRSSQFIADLRDRIMELKG